MAPPLRFNFSNYGSESGIQRYGNGGGGPHGAHQARFGFICVDLILIIPFDSGLRHKGAHKCFYVRFPRFVVDFLDADKDKV